MRNYRKWTEEEEEYVKVSYQDTPLKVIAERINRTVGSVKSKLKKIDLEYVETKRKQKWCSVCKTTSIFVKNQRYFCENCRRLSMKKTNRKQEIKYKKLANHLIKKYPERTKMLDKVFKEYLSYCKSDFQRTRTKHASILEQHVDKEIYKALYYAEYQQKELAELRSIINKK